MGHLMLHGLDVATAFDRWQERITMVHLHGVEGGRDHLPLDRCPMAQRAAVTDRLNRFDGVISLEVFSVAALNASITHLLSQDWRLRRSAGSAVQTPTEAPDCW
jgi:sugar phosphate isomerase/epimerase